MRYSAPPTAALRQRNRGTQQIVWANVHVFCIWIVTHQCLTLELYGPARHLSFLFRASVRHTDACHSQGAQGTDREHPQAGSCQTAKDDGGKPGVRSLARSKRGTRFRTASPLGGTRQRRRRFCSPWVGRDQGRRHFRWRSPDDRNWLSFHDRYQLRGQPHPHGLNMLGLNRFERS